MLQHIRRHGVDIGVPLAIAVLGTVEILGWRPPGALAALALEWLACVALVFRRGWPMTAGAVAAAVTVAIPYVGPELNDLSTPILVVGLGVFGAARYVRDLRGLAVLGFVVAALMVSMALTRDGANFTDIVFVLVLLTPGYVFGRVMRLLADRNRILAEHAALLVRQQATAKREAVAAERARMARELHDVIAHSISAMTVQAAAAQDLVVTRPDAAIEALRVVQEAGRGALAETSQLLRLMRDHDDELGLAPERDVTQVVGLVDEFRRHGLEVDLTVHGGLEGIGRTVAVSAYRVVREVLTNALRYAADRRVSLRLARQHDVLEVVAENRVPAAQPAGAGGLGLVGLAERVDVHGGTLAYGCDGDVFRVSVCLPTPVGVAA